MKVLGAISLPRGKMLEYKTDAFKKLLHGILSITRLNYPQVQQALSIYLQEQGLFPTDESVMAWLQNNPGDYIGLMIFEDHEDNLTFMIATGTQAELKQIGEQKCRSQKD